jgi:hypothetical protein
MRAARDVKRCGLPQRITQPVSLSTSHSISLDLDISAIRALAFLDACNPSTIKRVYVNTNFGSTFLPLKFKIIVVAICFTFCPGLVAGQTLCGSFDDSEPPAMDDLPCALPESSSVGSVSFDSAVATGEEAAATTLPRATQAGPYAEAVNTVLRANSLKAKTIPLADLATEPFLILQPQDQETLTRDSFNWRAAVQQSFLFLIVQHTLRLAIEPETRANLQGAFFKDYQSTLKSLRGWGDGDSFTTNYVGHPMMGAVSGFIQIHNDPAGMRQTIEASKTYHDSRLKALAWSAAYSLQFELGLLSEASLGNVGMTPRKSSRHPMGLVDLVVTPVVGTSWLIGEDALDRFVIGRIERHTGSRALRNVARSFLNPTRSIANLLRLKRPWHRDTR